ncbi:MAG: hypothetical protein OSB62_03140 [Alphaproteobacteria bacterium]|nr:hypothetical protein [Alphaproteobacteria bacterium]
MSLVDVLNAALYAALAIIAFKLAVIMLKRGHDAFYVAPEPEPFEDDEEDEIEMIEDAFQGEKVQCPYCGLKVIDMPEVDKDANCNLCKKNVMTDL